MPTQAVLVATLGGQPQIITLTLDLLLAQGHPIQEVLVVHFSKHTKRYQDALQTLAQEFIGDRYQQHQVHYRPIPIAYGIDEIEELIQDDALAVIQNQFDQIFPQLKSQQYRIHLCPTGGRRLLGMLALVAAQTHFDRMDRIWHLYSSDRIRDQTDRGAMMHIQAASSELKLLQIPFQPFAQAILQSGALQSEQRIQQAEQSHCQAVLDRLTQTQIKVLKAIAQGQSPQEVATTMSVTPGAISSHLTKIYAECRNAWAIPAEDRNFDYRRLREYFAEFFRQRL